MFAGASGYFVAIILVALGGIAGALFMRFWGPQVKANRDLENKLKEAENQLVSYREEVTQHFTETSRLVNNLTQSYRDVHEHLANSAMKLTSPTISQQFFKQLERETALNEEDDVVDVDTHDAFDENDDGNEQQHSGYQKEKTLE